MGFDWKGADGPVSNGGGGERAERIPPGYYKLRIAKVLNEKKGEPWMTKNGDPFVMIIFEDNSQREATQGHVCNEANGWKLAQLLSRLGWDLSNIIEEPWQFSHSNIYEKFLTGEKSQCWARVDHDGKYANVMPMHEHEVKENGIDTELSSHPDSDTPQLGTTIKEADIPF